MMSDLEHQAKAIGKTGHEAQRHSQRVQQRHERFAAQHQPFAAQGADMPHLITVQPKPKQMATAGTPPGRVPGQSGVSEQPSSVLRQPAASSPFLVPHGQLTFDAEGQEGGAFHTRKAHWPGAKSGVTIGRGYDLGQHKAAQIVSDMLASGIAEADAKQFAPAAGRQGRAAKSFLTAHQATLPEITPPQQNALFARTYQESDRDVRRLSRAYAASLAKETPAGAHPAAQGDQSAEQQPAAQGDPNGVWDTLHPALHDLLVDLRFRGDYTARSRAFLQPLLVNNDLRGVQRVMADRTLWPGVPQDRFQRRSEFLRQAAAQEHVAQPQVAAQEQAAPSAEKPQNASRPLAFVAGPLLAMGLAWPGAQGQTGAGQEAGGAPWRETVTNAPLAAAANAPQRTAVNASQRTAVNASLETLLAKPHLTASEILHARQLIGQEKEAQRRGDLYERLQTKTQYRNQRDNFSAASAADTHNNAWLRTKKDGKVTAGDIMCNETSLAMNLETLGIGNPDANGYAQFEDYLESRRAAQKMGARTETATLGRLAAALGAKYTQVGPVKRGEAWWEDNARAELRAGHALMLSVGGHIVRLQGVNKQGLVVDDPYGKITFFDGKKTPGVSQRVLSRGWGHDYTTTQTNAATPQGRAVRHDSRNITDEKATRWAGASNVWSWEDVSRHRMLWVTTFYPQAEAKQPAFRLAPDFERVRTKSIAPRAGRAPQSVGRAPLRPAANTTTRSQAKVSQAAAAGSMIAPPKPLATAPAPTLPMAAVTNLPMTAAPTLLRIAAPATTFLPAATSLPVANSLPVATSLPPATNVVPAGGQASRNTLQRKGEGAHPDVDPVSLREDLLRQGGTGSAPDTNLRAQLSGPLGFDPVNARLHRGPAAAQAARRLHAEAFTIGRDVFFGAHRFDPSSGKGLGLIAHELTHVGQQTGTTGSKTRFYTQSGGDAMEQEAQQTARMVLANVGNRDGLLVTDYVRYYESEDGYGLTRDDQQRLDRISLQALKRAEQKLAALERQRNVTIDAIEVDISLNLSEMSDEDAIAIWADALIAGIRDAHSHHSPQSQSLTPVAEPYIQRMNMTFPQTPTKNKDESIAFTHSGSFPDRFDGNKSKQRAGTVKAILPPKAQGGSTPDADPLGWSYVPKVAVQKPGKSNASKPRRGWVRFHLLNHNIGGTGKDMLNLVPTLQIYNLKPIWRDFEEAAKDVNQTSWTAFELDVAYHTNVFVANPNPDHGHDQLQFFPKQITAEIAKYDGTQKTWTGVKNGKVTMAVPAPSVTPGNTEFVLTDCSDKTLKDVFQIDGWLAVRLKEMAPELERSKPATVQELYETISFMKATWAGVDQRKVDKDWPKLQDALNQTAGTMLRIFDGWKPAGQTAIFTKDQEISLSDLVAAAKTPGSTLDGYKQKLALDNNVIRLFALVSAADVHDAQDLYEQMLERASDKDTFDKNVWAKIEPCIGERTPIYRLPLKKVSFITWTKYKSLKDIKIKEITDEAENLRKQIKNNRAIKLHEDQASKSINEAETSLKIYTPSQLESSARKAMEALQEAFKRIRPQDENETALLERKNDLLKDNPLSETAQKGFDTEITLLIDEVYKKSYGLVPKSKVDESYNRWHFRDEVATGVEAQLRSRFGKLQLTNEIEKQAREAGLAAGIKASQSAYKIDDVGERTLEREIQKCLQTSEENAIRTAVDHWVQATYAARVSVLQDQDNKQAVQELQIKVRDISTRIQKSSNLVEIAFFRKAIDRYQKEMKPAETPIVKPAEPRREEREEPRREKREEPRREKRKKLHGEKFEESDRSVKNQKQSEKKPGQSQPDGTGS